MSLRMDAGVVTVAGSVTLRGKRRVSSLDLSWLAAILLM